MNDTAKTKYCFDTSALVSSWRLHYRINTFPSLWKHIGELMDDNQIIIPEEVEKEMGAGEDNLVKWFKSHKACVLPITKQQLDMVSEIVNKYPLVSQYKKPRPYHADPFVIAVAKIETAPLSRMKQRTTAANIPKYLIYAKNME